MHIAPLAGIAKALAGRFTGLSWVHYYVVAEESTATLPFLTAADWSYGIEYDRAYAGYAHARCTLHLFAEGSLSQYDAMSLLDRVVQRIPEVPIELSGSSVPAEIVQWQIDGDLRISRRTTSGGVVVWDCEVPMLFKVQYEV